MSVRVGPGAARTDGIITHRFDLGHYGNALAALQSAQAGFTELGGTVWSMTAQVGSMSGGQRQQIAVALISHSMPAVLEVADRIQVLRLDTREASVPAEGTTVEELVGAMTGALDFSQTRLPTTGRRRSRHDPAYDHRHEGRRERLAVPHDPAFRQVANRLVGFLHGCLRHGTPYDETTAWPPPPAEPLTRTLGRQLARRDKRPATTTS